MREPMEELMSLLARCAGPDTYQIVLSDPRDAEQEEKRVTLTKRGLAWQLERFRNDQAFHENVEQEELLPMLAQLMEHFKQLNAWDPEHQYSLKLTKKGKPLFNRRRCLLKPRQQAGHDREKNYLLREGEVVPPLVDMGVFTKEGKVVRTMYDKYRQINRFLELVNDEMDRFPADKPLHIIDFGCGKSYLTFILYYYLVQVRGMDVSITGLDLKAAVIGRCNAAAEKYGYDKLHFELGDINGYTPDGPVDMVITLHACDTATDYALYNAVTWDVKLILSVPCCQHEVNAQMQAERLSLFTRYGLIQERMAALLTDAARADLLTYRGYSTQVVEFIDMAHTPKNILLRARKANLPESARRKALEEVRTAMEEFHVKPTLYRLLAE